MALLRKFLHLEEYLQPIHFQNLGKLLLTMSLLWFYFTFAERLTTWYGNDPSEMAVFWDDASGKHFAPMFWTMVVCNFIIPVPILAIKKLAHHHRNRDRLCHHRRRHVARALPDHRALARAQVSALLPGDTTGPPGWKITLMASSFGIMVAALPAVLEIRAHDFDVGNEGRAPAPRRRSSGRTADA